MFLQKGQKKKEIIKVQFFVKRIWFTTSGVQLDIFYTYKSLSQ